MSQYPYKQKEIADNITELKPYDFTRQLDSISRDMGELSRQTAKMAEQNFLNTFEIESRKALFDCYERNQNNPKQLEDEQTKIMQKYVAALPNKALRDTAKLKFQIHALGYLGKAKENLYNQQFKQLQATTLDKTKTILNGIQENGKYLHNPNLAVSGTAVTAIGDNLKDLEVQLAMKDEKGNFVVSPHEQAQLRNEVRQRLTASDLDYFNGLESMGEKEKFYKEYKEKATKRMWLDHNDPRGYSEQGMDKNNTDWPTYEHNLEIMEKTFEAAKQARLNGISKQEQGIYAIKKIRVFELLDTEKMKLDEEEVTNPFKVLAFLQQVNDYGKPFNGFKGSDGTYAPFLDAKEMYDYRKGVREKYLNDVIAAIDKPTDKTYFSYGFEGIKNFFDKNARSHGLNDYDKMDIMTEYYRQMTHAGIPAGLLQSRADIAYNKETVDATKRAIVSWVLGSDKFTEHEKNIISTTPPEVTLTMIDDTDNTATPVIPAIKPYSMIKQQNNSMSPYPAINTKR